MGHVTPLSIIPHQTLPYTGEMTFFQRFYNVFLTTYDLFLRRFNYIPAHNKLAQKYFKDGIEGEIPDVSKVEKEISLALVNSHRSIDTPRPQMPGQINVGAAHIKQANNLPQDLNVSFIIKDYLNYNSNVNISYF